MISLERYIVTPEGIIYDKTTGNPIKTFKSNKYLQCCIFDENGKHVMGVHNVVAQALCPDWFEGCVVHHKDNNQHNNNIENLECMKLSDHTRQHQVIKYHDKIMICPICKNEFVWTGSAQSKYQRNEHKIGPCCSRKCVRQTFISDPPRNTRAIRCIETNIIYESITTAARQLNITYGKIWKCLNKKMKSANNMHFEYV